jgi:hypothetical protein
MGIVSVKAVTIVLPTRAYLWLKFISDRDKQTPEAKAKGMVLLGLHSLPGVDLAKNPVWP